MLRYSYKCEVFLHDKSTRKLVQSCPNDSLSILTPTLPHHINMNIMVCSEHKPIMINQYLMEYAKLPAPIRYKESK